MSMAEVLATLIEEAKEDDNQYLPWTCMLLKKECIEKSKSCYDCKIFQDYDTNMRREHGKQRRI